MCILEDIRSVRVELSIEFVVLNASLSHDLNPPSVQVFEGGIHAFHCRKSSTIEAEERTSILPGQDDEMWVFGSTEIDQGKT
jgi:hypothetical protein